MTKRAEAPGGLALVQRFVNTIDIEESRDELATPELLGRWLSEMSPGAGPVQPDGAGWARALALRESLRGLLLANNGGPVYPLDVATLNQAALQCLLRVRFHADGLGRLEPQGEGVDAALSRILAGVITAMAQGTWPRLKACRKHSCRWAFYDHSKNRSSTWCNMAVCGSRIKSRAYRDRRRARPRPQAPARVEPSRTPPTQ